MQRGNFENQSVRRVSRRLEEEEKVEKEEARYCNEKMPSRADYYLKKLSPVPSPV